MKLAWITGANGLIGNYLVQTASRFAPQWRVRALTRGQLDLLDFAAVRREFQKDQPQLVIHCAAITVVNDAQKNPDLARRVNVEVTKLLAELAAEIPFVFFSTDLVFDGRKGNYSESDPANPLHVYGETKLAAEAIVLKNPRHFARCGDLVEQFVVWSTTFGFLVENRLAQFDALTANVNVARPLNERTDITIAFPTERTESILFRSSGRGAATTRYNILT